MVGPDPAVSYERIASRGWPVKQHGSESQRPCRVAVLAAEARGHGVSFTSIAGKRWRWWAKSGSGKSVTALSLLQLLPQGCSNPTGSILLDGREMIGASSPDLHRARGGLAGIVFQEPMTSLNPLHRVGRQVARGDHAAPADACRETAQAR